MYGVSAAPNVPHQNHKTVFAELADLVKSIKITESSNLMKKILELSSYK